MSSENKEYEKARELMNKYFEICNHPLSTVSGKHERAKKAAILCVDEIIGAINDMEDPTMFINGQWTNAITFYQSVKDIINTF